MPPWFDNTITAHYQEADGTPVVRVLFCRGERPPRHREMAVLEVRFYSPDSANNGVVREVRLIDRELGGLTPSFLQRFPWEKWLTAADAFARAKDIAPMDAAIRATKGKRPGRRGHDDAFLPAVARRYVDLRCEGVRAPVRQIADEDQVSRNTAAGWVKQAREQGLLPPARRPGKAG